ncbi:MAG: recombinase family protein [Ruminococcus sp.]|nr:recombinase family protein [Ruminococcus sp.]
MKQYCIYLRKSRADLVAEARGEGETLAKHEKTLLELAKYQQLNIVKIYKEIVSGDSIATRPQMQKLLQDISNKIYDGVLVMEIERLARGDTIDQGIISQIFKKSETKIITPIKTYNPNNEFDEEYFEFSLFMSRREYKTIKRRMQTGRIASVKEGNYICTTAPYGYKKINPEPKVHTLEIIPEEADAVRMIYDMYLSGKGAKAIASTLNCMQIQPQKNTSWEPSSIKKILSNPIYIGKVHWKPQKNKDILCKGLHEAIITEETFNRVQNKRINNPATQIQAEKPMQNYYHNILYCSNCGHQMKRRIVNRKTEHMLCIYQQCKGIIVSSLIQDIDEVILSSFQYRIKELKELLNIKQKEPEKQNLYNKKEIILTSLEKIKKQKEKLHVLLETDVYDIPTFLERSKKITSQQLKLEEKLKEFEKISITPEQTHKNTIIKLRYVLEHFNDANAEEKNKLLKSVVKKIYYKKTIRMCKNKRLSDLSIKIDFL